MAGQHVCQLYQPGCDTGVVHQVSGKNKQRNRKHGEGLGGGQGLLYQNRPRNLRPHQEEGKSGHRNRKGHRHSKEQEN